MAPRGRVRVRKGQRVIAGRGAGRAAKSACMEMTERDFSTTKFC